MVFLSVSSQSLVFRPKKHNVMKVFLFSLFMLPILFHSIIAQSQPLSAICCLSSYSLPHLPYYWLFSTTVYLFSSPPTSSQFDVAYFWFFHFGHSSTSLCQLILLFRYLLICDRKEYRRLSLCHLLFIQLLVLIRCTLRHTPSCVFFSLQSRSDSGHTKSALIWLTRAVTRFSADLQEFKATKPV